MEKERLEMYARRLLDLAKKITHAPDDGSSIGYGKGQRMILFYLSKAGEAPSGELSKALHVGTGRIGNALKELETKGYVLRRKDERDGRRVLVSLTEKGKEFTLERKKEFLRITKVALAAVGEEEFVHFLNLYEKIVKAEAEALGKEKTCSNSTKG